MNNNERRHKHGEDNALIHGHRQIPLRSIRPTVFLEKSNSKKRSEIPVKSVDYDSETIASRIRRSRYS